VVAKACFAGAKGGERIQAGGEHMVGAEVHQYAVAVVQAEDLVQPPAPSGRVHEVVGDVMRDDSADEVRRRAASRGGQRRAGQQDDRGENCDEALRAVHGGEE
jgi:hypothetical protein